MFTVGEHYIKKKSLIGGIDMQKNFFYLLFFFLLIVSEVFAQNCLKEENVTESLVVKKKQYIDNITINPSNKVITIRTYSVYADAEDKAVRRGKGKNIILRDVADNPDTAEDETSLEYTNFITSSSIDLLNIVNAVKGSGKI